MASGSNSKRKNYDKTSDEPKAKKPGPFWKTGLLSSMNDPELQVFVDDKLTIIKDKYPKVCPVAVFFNQIYVHVLM